MIFLDETRYINDIHTVVLAQLKDYVGNDIDMFFLQAQLNVNTKKVDRYFVTFTTYPSHEQKASNHETVDFDDIDSAVQFIKDTRKKRAA